METERLKNIHYNFFLLTIIQLTNLVVYPSKEFIEYSILISLITCVALMTIINHKEKKEKKNSEAN